MFSDTLSSVRKEIKVRPGYTPLEDVAVFRSQRAQQAVHSTPPKGHVPGWTPPAQSTSKPVPAQSVSANATGSSDAQSKAAAKNAKRAEKRKEKRVTDQAEFIRKQLYGDAADSDRADASSTTKTVDKLAEQLEKTTVS